jgi:hypothetical protein
MPGELEINRDRRLKVSRELTHDRDQVGSGVLLYRN